MKLPHLQIVIAIFCFAMAVGCNHDDKAREAAAAEALEAAKTPPVEQPTAPISTEQQPQARPKTAGTMRLMVESGSATKGSAVCVAIKAKDFKSIVSMQYSLKWDPKVLKCKDVKNFGLPQLSIENFGRHILDQGLLTYSWFDANVKGISKGDGETLYELCFESVGQPGSKSAVQIVDVPTIIEIANVNSEFYTLDATPGTVLVK
jgi:hypothetical protein